MRALQTIKYGLSNFKAFGEGIQRISLKPVTLLYGPNSSGKSSIIHSLLFLHELSSAQYESDLLVTTLGQDSVDLGGFKNYAHGKSEDVTLHFSHTFQCENLARDGFSDWEVVYDIQYQSGQLKLIGTEYRINGESAFELFPTSPKADEFKFKLNKESNWYNFYFIEKASRILKHEKLLKFLNEATVQKFQKNFLV